MSYADFLVEVRELRRRMVVSIAAAVVALRENAGDVDLAEAQLRREGWGGST